VAPTVVLAFFSVDITSIAKFPFLVSSGVVDLADESGKHQRETVPDRRVALDIKRCASQQH
jgi:hypothetical protein